MKTGKLVGIIAAVVVSASLLALTTGLHVLYKQSAWWLRLGRNWGLGTLDHLTVLKSRLIRMANGHRMDLPERYRDGVDAMPF